MFLTSDLSDLASEYRESVCEAYHKFVQGAASKVVEQVNQMVADGLRGDELSCKVGMLIGRFAEAIAFADDDADENGEVPQQKLAGHREQLMDALDGDCGGIAECSEQPEGGRWLVTADDAGERILAYVPEEDGGKA
ncbi:MAG: hypothetical protein IKZ87_01655 [Actinomycetaceae bacterium]|nr:hypothetical protein [Actinomycetaceae bacterium]